MATELEKLIPTFKTTDSGWIRFHKELDRIFSRKEANKYWLQAWGNTGGDANYDANTSDLREYMQTKGIDLSAPTTWQGITDSASDFYKTIRVYVWIAVIVIVTLISLKIFVFNRNTVIRTK